MKFGGDYMNRDDFEFLKSGIIYFDNGATTLKPKSVIDETVNYYTKYTANAHRGDYKNSLIVDKLYEETRDKVKTLINATSSDEIVFTKGATESLNMIVFGFMKEVLKQGDEVLLTKTEHASNVLAWLELEKMIEIKIKYISLDDNLEVTMENVLKQITDRTKVISLAHVTNTIGDVRPIYEIGKFCKEKGIYLVVDGAQSVPHMKVDVQELNIDFLAFSAHKMLGPTGVGVLYGKYNLLDKMVPLNVGGGMNTFFESSGALEYNMLPRRLEAGTPNIAGVIAFSKAIDYINETGYDKILKQEKMLRDYLVKELEKIENIEVYNKKSSSGVVLFNIKNVFAQDTAVYLDHYDICVRAGNHCAKMLKEEIGIRNTCRISLYFYNTIEEIDKLLNVLRNSKNIFEVVI